MTYYEKGWNIKKTKQSKQLYPRLLPLLASILTLPLFYHISFAITKNRITSLLALLMFSINNTPCNFSAEFKPYAVDLSIYLTLAYLLVSSNLFVCNNRQKLLGIAGIIAVLISYCSIVVLACIGLYFIFKMFTTKKSIKKTLFYS